jgi:deazaflavin-dependent oxidoreductase (nitroreductase family)
VALYAIGGGRLLGHRFLMLRHRGRRSGRIYSTVLEVIAWDAAAREAVVMSGFGSGAQWYRNVLAGGAVEVRIGGDRFTPDARPLSDEEAAAALRSYERRNRIAAPVARRVLGRLAGVAHDGSDVARLRVVERLPLVAFRPGR